MGVPVSPLVARRRQVRHSEERIEEVNVMTSTPDPLPMWLPAVERVSVEEMARRQGVRPIASVDELIEPDTFESDAELDEFLADLYVTRRAGMA